MRLVLVVGLGLGLGLGHAAACGSAPAPQKASSSSPPPREVRPGVPPPEDEAGLRKLLVEEVLDGGLRFADSTCQARFGTARRVEPEEFDGFARCLASLHLRPTGRPDSLDDVSVLTDDAGFELEAQVVGGHLHFIGFSARTTSAPELPTITPQALESLRVGGDPAATITADQARLLATPSRALTEFLRLCLGEDGHLTVMPATSTTRASAAAFSAVARTWTFRPFVVEEKPLEVCSIVGFQYPPEPRDANRDRLPRPPQVSKSGHPFYLADPRDLEALRLSGDKLIQPADELKADLRGKRLVGSFKLCLDETGHYESGVMLKSTGLAGYDATLVRALMTWTFRPYLVDGVAVPVCGAFTFVYTQR